MHWTRTHPLRLFLCACLLPLLVAVVPLFAGGVGAYKKHLKRIIATDDEPAALKLLDKLEADGSPEAIMLIIDIMAQMSEDLYIQGEKILVKMGGPGLAEAFGAELARKKAPWYRAAIILNLAAGFDDADSERWLLDGLTHRYPGVQQVAMDGLVKRRSKEAIPRLIDLLEDIGINGGALAFSARHALVVLTGHDYHIVEDWRNFWEGSKDSLVPKALGEEEGEEGSTGVALVEQPDAPEFFGVAIPPGANVAFIIDCSGSMERFDPGGEKGGRGSSWEVRQRMRRAKLQLKNCIKGINKQSRFNVIAFNQTVTVLNKSLVKANNTSRVRAWKFIDRLVPLSATHTDDALARAFQDPNVDTIMLLTDGSPMKTTGERAPELIPAILRQVKKVNRLRRVRIHTFGFTGGAGQWPPGSKYSGGRAPEEEPPASPYLSMAVFLMCWKKRGSI